MKLAVVGATGLVGTMMNKVLEEFDLPISQYIPVASQRSIGKKIYFKNREYELVGMQEAVDLKPDVAIFSAGGGTSLEWAPRFEAVGTFVVDNSSAWRMHEDKKLVVPEINGDLLTLEDKIIANPNCSTIQMVMALAPLHQKYKIKRLVISTYQSFTGTGVKAVDQYEAEKNGRSIDSDNRAYPHPIFENAIPHCDIFLDNGYTKEEIKLVDETRKILGDQAINITATAVRIPVFGGHSESINVEFDNDFDLTEIRTLLNETPGIIVQDNVHNNEYPTPLSANDKDEVFVGRLRRDYSNPNTLNMWVVSDNLRKGAATNAVQIVNKLISKGLIGQHIPLAR